VTSSSGRWPPRPCLARAFYKAHGLGNDYLVLEEGDGWLASEEAVRRVCHPHRGVGADGLVALLSDRSGGLYRARMFNPDGGEFERSGNGLRILGAYLASRGVPDPYRVSVGGGEVSIRIGGSDRGLYDVTVDLGPARVGPEAVQLDPDALGEDGSLAGPGGEPLRVVPVSVGNPHLVVLTPELTEARLEEVGSFLVGHPALAHGANVQLAHPIGPGRCRVLIWERGVGPTSTSGTSASAVAAAMVSTGALAAGTVTVEMPGGAFSVDVGAGLEVVLRGPVEEICEGTLAPPFLRA